MFFDTTVADRTKKRSQGLKIGREKIGKKQHPESTAKKVLDLGRFNKYLQGRKSRRQKDMKNKFNVNLDNELYMVVCNHKSGPYTMEIPLADMTKKNVMKELIEGQYDDPLAVIYFNPVEGHARDVSEDIAREWMERLAQDPDIDESGFEPEMRIPAFIKMHLPDYEAYAAEVMDDYRLNQQDPERLYGCPARI